MTPDYFQTLARYNEWANRRLYAACAELPDAERRAPRQAFFGSILATLDHILLGDRAWLSRLEGVPSDIARLDQTLYDEFDALAQARVREDRRIIAYVDALDPADLPHVVEYRTIAGSGQRTSRLWILAHLFNHQTHHRGQVHDMLSQTAVAPPPLDLIYYLREVGQV